MSDEKERAARVTDGLIADAVQLRNEIDRLRKRAGYTDSEVIADLRKMLETEQAEVERLRADKDEAIALMVKAQRKAGELEAENAELRAQLSHYDGFAGDAVNDVDYWRLKARDHWDSYRGCESDNQALKAKLAWFKKREPLIRQGLKDEACSNGYDCCYEWALVERWEAENPEPSEGT